MDTDEGVSAEELAVCLAALRRINRWFGGLSTTRRGLDDLLARAGRPAAGWTVLDIGGGSGDAAPAILGWGRDRGVEVRVTTMDRDPRSAEEAARRLASVEGAEARAGDLFDLEPRGFDVVHGALFLHHFDGDDAARALAWMARVARVGVVLNDLRRTRVAWALTRWATPLLSRNRLIRHDGPLSVARAFREEDWRSLGEAAGIDLRWTRTWAWRFAVSGVVR